VEAGTIPALITERHGGRRRRAAKPLRGGWLAVYCSRSKPDGPRRTLPLSRCPGELRRVPSVSRIPAQQVVAATALRTTLPDAIRVLDAFHVTRLGLSADDEVRRRVQQQSTGQRGRRDDPLYRIRRDDPLYRIRRDDPLYRIRRVLRRGHENLTDTA